MNGKFIVGLCTTVEVVCISAIAAIGLKRNNDAYKAELKCIDAECEMYRTKIEGILKDAQIKCLEKELAELKEKYEVKEGEA